MIIPIRPLRIMLAFLCGLLTSPTISRAQTANSVDSLLKCIDQAIDHSTQYFKPKEQRISSLRYNLKKARSTYERYQASYKLQEEYATFVNDSSISFLHECIRLAYQMKKSEWANKCRILLAQRSINTGGQFTEALSILNGVDTSQLEKEDLGRYYMLYVQIYDGIAQNSNFTPFKKQYEEAAKKYRQLMFGVLPRNDSYYFMYKQLSLQVDSKYKEALRVNNEWIKHVEKDSRLYALTTLYRYLAYKDLNDSTKMMYWLGESVLTDIKNGVTDQGSMWEMANQLMVKGDIDRAYKYINFNSDCAGKFGSRTRLAQIAPLLADIAKMYKQQNDKYNERQAITLAIISILALLLSTSLVYVNRQRHRITKAKDELAKSNSQLSSLNGQLRSLNEQLKSSNLQLSSVNTQLSEANTKLSEANQVKEEYVGRFMRLCSLYINKLEALRKKVNKKVKTRQYADLYEMTRPQDFKEEELEEFYANFDSAFLHLFPNFVESFNALLRPEERIELNSKDSLNTPIRIFALIRLGINDSSKIADFLHYSVNTIYNYRAHIKKGALNSRESFEEEVKKIGTF